MCVLGYFRKQFNQKISTMKKSRLFRKRASKGKLSFSSLNKDFLLRLGKKLTEIIPFSSQPCVMESKNKKGEYHLTFSIPQLVWQNQSRETQEMFDIIGTEDINTLKIFSVSVYLISKELGEIQDFLLNKRMEDKNLFISNQFFWDEKELLPKIRFSAFKSKEDLDHVSSQLKALYPNLYIGPGKNKTRNENLSLCVVVKKTHGVNKEIQETPPSKMEIAKPKNEEKLSSASTLFQTFIEMLSPEERIFFAKGVLPEGFGIFKKEDSMEIRGGSAVVKEV